MNFEIRVSGLDGMAKVVVNLPQGLGRFGVENATAASAATLGFEWYLKNHLGSTMLVYGTGSGSGSVRAALPRPLSFLRNSLPLPPSEGLFCCGDWAFQLPSDQIVRTVYNIPAER